MRADVDGMLAQILPEVRYGEINCSVPIPFSITCVSRIPIVGLE